MSDEGPVETGIRRLNAAMEALEVAVGRKQASGKTIGELERDLHQVAEDRSGLAQRLDQVEQRAAMLEDANDEAAELLRAAIGTVRAMLSEDAG
jgi:hypothetical protein